MKGKRTKLTGKSLEMAESVERRVLAERKAEQAAVTSTQSEGQAESGLLRLRTTASRAAFFAWLPVGAFDSKQEPDALAAHVRICAGGAG